MRLNSFVAALIAAAVFAPPNLCPAQQITVHPDHTNGVYQTGNTVHWLVDLKDASNDAPPAHYRLLKGGLTEAGSGDLAFTNSAAEIDSAFDGPGTMLMEVTWKPGEGKPAPIAP
ncbi:MAG TPA: hypothetical protein VFD66_02400 [Verrucomicrobiae bacterium]|nr:hypothetical protein [Verrucomicrobiae bacterium]